MLQRIRDGASGPLAYIVVAVIAVVFGVWGIGSYFTPSSDPAVASVGSTSITHSQLQQAFTRSQQSYNMRKTRLRKMMGDHFDPDMLPPAPSRRDVLNGMIDRAVMTQYAKNAGFRVTNANLLAEIRSDPHFQSNGQFSAARYKALLRQSGYAPAQYEALLRHEMLGGQVRQIIAGTAFAAPPEVDAAYRKAHEQRQISVLSFDPSAFVGQVTLGDSAVQRYYKKHAKQFMRPQQVKLAYVSLDADQLSTPAPDQKTLHRLYDAHKGELGKPARRSADSIKISIKGSNDSAARKTVQAVVKAAKKGQSLKKIASRTDGATFQQIDKQPKSALPDAVGAALFDLKSGALSNPVRAAHAWYVLRLTATTPASTPKFDDPAVQARLKAMARKQSIVKAFKAKADRLDDLAYQAPNGLKVISKKLGLKIRHSGWITPNGGSDKGLGQYDAVRKAAFSDAVLKDKLNSKVLDLGDQRRVVLRVAEHKPAKQKPLAEVRQTIHDRLIQQKAAQKAEQAAQQAMKKAQRGQSLSALAASQKGATLKQAGYIGRGGGDLDPKIVAAAFALPADDKSRQAEYKVVSGQKGAAALVAMSGTRVQDKGSSKQDNSERSQMAQQQSRYNASLEYRALDRYLRQQADVDIHSNALN